MPHQAPQSQAYACANDWRAFRAAERGATTAFPCSERDGARAEASAKAKTDRHIGEHASNRTPVEAPVEGRIQRRDKRGHPNDPNEHAHS